MQKPFTVRTAAINAAQLLCLVGIWYVISFAFMTFARVCRGERSALMPPADMFFALYAALLLTAAQWLLSYCLRLSQRPQPAVDAPLEPIAPPARRPAPRLAGGGFLAGETRGFLMDPEIERARLHLINALGVPQDLMQPVFVTAATFPDPRPQTTPVAAPAVVSAAPMRETAYFRSLAQAETSEEEYEAAPARGLPPRVLDPDLPPESEWPPEVVRLGELLRQQDWFAGYGEDQAAAATAQQTYAEVEEAARVAAVAGHRVLARQLWQAVAPEAYEWPV